MEVRNIFVFLILLNISKIKSHLYSGSSCKTHDNSAGVCKSARDCSWATQGLASQTLSHQDLVKCGFHGGELIICCKEIKRKADEYCDLIKNMKSEWSALDHHVINGIPVQIGEYPHVVGLKYVDRSDWNTKLYLCAGSLISANYVLTAAHCVNRRNDVPVSVKMGRITLDSGYSFDGEQHVEINIKRMIIHPKYSSRKSYDDIALIELVKPVQKFSKVLHPACLYTKNSLNHNDKLFVTGWGKFDVRNRAQSVFLRKGELGYVTPEECNREFENFSNSELSEGIKDGQVCAYDVKNLLAIKRVDSCQGDSGGPLNLRVGDIEHIVGITSAGFSCASDTPGIYTKVASYLDFIESNVWPRDVTI